MEKALRLAVSIVVYPSASHRQLACNCRSIERASEQSNKKNCSSTLRVLHGTHGERANKSLSKEQDKQLLFCIRTSFYWIWNRLALAWLLLFEYTQFFFARCAPLVFILGFRCSILISLVPTPFLLISRLLHSLHNIKCDVGFARVMHLNLITSV